MSQKAPQNTPLEWGLWSYCYLRAADTVYEIPNRKTNFWIAAYYLLYHSLELALKMKLQIEGRDVPPGHVVSKIIHRHEDLFTFSKTQEEAINNIEKLNEGPGQLRYPNRTKEQFLPNVFEGTKQIVEQLLKEQGINETSFYMNDLDLIQNPKYHW